MQLYKLVTLRKVDLNVLRFEGRDSPSRYVLALSVFPLACNSHLVDRPKEIVGKVNDVTDPFQVACVRVCVCVQVHLPVCMCCGDVLFLQCYYYWKSARRSHTGLQCLAVTQCRYRCSSWDKQHNASLWWLVISPKSCIILQGAHAASFTASSCTITSDAILQGAHAASFTASSYTMLSQSTTLRQHGCGTFSEWFWGGWRFWYIVVPRFAVALVSRNGQMSSSQGRRQPVGCECVWTYSTRLAAARLFIG